MIVIAAILQLVSVCLGGKVIYFYHTPMTAVKCQIHMTISQIAMFTWTFSVTNFEVNEINCISNPHFARATLISASAI